MGDSADELRRVTQRFFRRFGALSADRTPCGKPLSTAYAHARMVLLERGERSQQALGGELYIVKSNVARLCAKMVREGHLRQRTNQDDGRSRLVSLSARGGRLAQEVDLASRQRFGALLYKLPEGTRAGIIGAVQQLVDALEDSDVACRERVAS